MDIFRNLKLVGKSLALACIIFGTASANVTPPPPNHSADVNSGYGKNSFGFYAKAGLLGYVANLSCNFYCYISYNYVFVPGISAYYAWRADNGMGVEVALEYEYDASDGIASDSARASRNFITPAVYFSEATHEMIWRVGLGYDIGMPYTYYSSPYSASNWQVTQMFHGVAILTSSEWILNNNNAIGMFFKAAFRFATAKDTDKSVNNISGTDFSHIMLTLGLSYRFNMGF